MDGNMFKCKKLRDCMQNYVVAHMDRSQHCLEGNAQNTWQTTCQALLHGSLNGRPTVWAACMAATLTSCSCIGH